MPLPSTIDPKTTAILDDIVRTNRERDELRADNDRLRASCDEMEREVSFLREQLSIAERKRDMFQRHAVALFTRLHDIVVVVNTALSDARLEATSGGAEAKPQPQNLDEINDGLRDLVATLRPEPLVEKQP